MERRSQTASVQIEIPERRSRGLILGFLEGFFEFAVEQLCAYLYEISRVPIVKAGYATRTDPGGYVDKSPDGTGPYVLAGAQPTRPVGASCSPAGVTTGSAASRPYSNSYSRPTVTALRSSPLFRPGPWTGPPTSCPASRRASSIGTGPITTTGSPRSAASRSSSTCPGRRPTTSPYARQSVTPSTGMLFPKKRLMVTTLLPPVPRAWYYPLTSNS